MTNPDDQSRAAFEAWAKSTFRYICLHRYEHPQYDGDPLPYKSSMCDAAWLAWLAAIEHAMKTMSERS